MLQNLKGRKEENHVELKDEMLLHYAKRKAQELPEVNYFIFGHRHIPIIEKVSKNAEVVILGDWISYFTYGVFEDGKMSLKYFEK